MLTHGISGFFLYAPDLAAGDLHPAAAGGLGEKIIRHFVDHRSAADDLRYGESIRKENAHRVAAVAEQRRQIPGVRGMRTFAGVIVGGGAGERVRGAPIGGSACRTLVDMKTKNLAVAVGIPRGEPEYFRRDENPLSRLIETDGAVESWIPRTAPHDCRGTGPAAEDTQNSLWKRAVFSLHTAVSLTM